MNFGLFEGESEDLNPKISKDGYGDFFLQYGGESSDQKDGHDSVLAVSHAGACFHFLRAWQDPTEELKKGFPNCCVFKYEYENKTFKLLEVIRL